MAEVDKFVLGVCSGFQVISKATDVGRLSSTPIIHEGLGLLDAEFKPLVCTDRVSATIVGKSFMTDAIGENVTGFHCHTYGEIIPKDSSRPILVSHVKRVNYRSSLQDLVSGFTNKEGNVVGILTHALLDENPVIIQSIVKSLDISDKGLDEIREVNSGLTEKIHGEIGISTQVQSKSQSLKREMAPVLLFTTATGSGSGKTFIVSGIAGALKKRGIKVGLIKVGGDIRDIVPALYLVKEPMNRYSSIKVANSGWVSSSESVEFASKIYDFLLIEGAMGPFTGFLNEEVERPSSTAEIAAVLGVPTIVVVACDKTGIEGAVVAGLNYVNIMKVLGINVKGIVLNKVCSSYLTSDVKQSITSAFSNVGVKLLGILPRIQLEGRGAIPEIEIKYEDFGAKAIETVESNLDLDSLIEVAKPAMSSSLDYETVLKRFKQLINSGCGLELNKGGPNC